MEKPTIPRRAPTTSSSERVDLRRAPIKIAASYAAVGLAWILLSDRVVEALVGRQPDAVWWQTSKGVFFVFVTAVLLALLVRRSMRRIEEAHARERIAADRLSLAVAASRMGVWERNLTTHETYLSGECHAIVGRSDFDGSFEAFARAVHPEDLPRVIATSESAVERRTSYTCEYRLLREDGSVRWVSEFAEPHYDAAGRPIGILGTVRDITARREAELARARSEAELATIYEHAPIMLLLLDEQLHIRRMNKAAIDYVGFDASSDPAQSCAAAIVGCLGSLDDPVGCGAGPQCAECPLRGALRDALRQGIGRTRVETFPSFLRGRRSRDLCMLVSTAPVETDGRRMVLVCLEDASEQRRLQRQFIEAQKSEALGQLAGGVAHDFNNILTATLLNVELIKRHEGLPGDVREMAQEIETHSRRAANLTRQLLLFSRRQVLQPTLVDLNGLIDDLLKMIRRLLGENIAIDFVSNSTLPPVLADAGMIEQVLLNLCINARDAMPAGGRLQIRTDTVDTTAAQNPPTSDARAGRFVRLRVSDTGTGIPEDVLPRIFEPFFTTKEVGKGTGLGLATVSGIVKQHLGWVDVATKQGVGTTFAVHLPASKEVAAEDETTSSATPLPHGSGTILLVEDEPGVRQVSARVLRACGYTVTEARNGIDALEKWKAADGNFDLLLTDMVMPEQMTGLELADRLRARRHDLRVILTSGYSAELTSRVQGRAVDVRLLQKPCSSRDLADAVAGALADRR
jgi:PAS domain S-box-containing protein